MAPRGGSRGPWAVLLPAMVLLVGGVLLQRLHYIHWETAMAHHSQAVTGDTGAGGGATACPAPEPCPACTAAAAANPEAALHVPVQCPACPQCATCPAVTEASGARRVDDAASASAMDLGTLHESHTPLVMLTFGNKAVWPMLSNWVANVRKAGLANNMLVGALDPALVEICKREGVPVEALDGAKAGMTNGQYLTKSGDDLRKYKLMASLKIGFALDLLKRQNQNVLISDSDTVWLRDPRAFMEEGPFEVADVLVSTDCIDTTADEICNSNYCGCAHVAFNTGIVFLRNSPATIQFVEAWKAKVLEDNDLTIRDQAAFNIVLREGMDSKRTVPGFENFPRQVLYAMKGRVKMGILPLLYFQNGHSYFAQKLHERRNIVPYVVHATYQYGDGAIFPFGKRQRMREAGLWLMEEKEYYEGNYLAVSWAGATLPEFRAGLDTDTRILVKHHFAEDAYRRKTVQNALAIAALLNRTLIMPRMLCYVDHMWKEMRAGRFAGAYGMSLPFDCPMDYLFELPRFFEEAGKMKPGMSFREPEFLNRLPPHLARAHHYVHVLPPGSPEPPATVTRNGHQVPATRVREGMTAKAVVQALDQFKHVRVLELSKAVTAFCGWENDAANNQFDERMRSPLQKKWEFKYMETGKEGVPNYKYWVPYDQFEWMNGFEDVRPLAQARQRPECAGAFSRLG